MPINMHTASTITLGAVEDTQGAKKLLRLVERGRLFINNTEAFNLSRRKANKLAYRWRGNRRGRRIAQWLARQMNTTGVSFEEPVEIRFD
jgi:hypothetical protein